MYDVSLRDDIETGFLCRNIPNVRQQSGFPSLAIRWDGCCWKRLIHQSGAISRILLLRAQCGTWCCPILRAGCRRCPATALGPQTALDSPSDVGGTEPVGDGGGRITVRQLVRERRIARREIAQTKAYVPLSFAPAERGEVDFGHAVVRLRGQELQVPFLAARLRFSGAMFVAAFPTERQDAFLLGQRWAFEFWGGVPRSVVYDNLKPAVAQLLRGHSRRSSKCSASFTASTATKPSSPIRTRVGRKAAWRTWSAMRGGGTSCLSLRPTALTS